MEETMTYKSASGCIELFLNESFDLAMATAETIEAAARLAEARGLYQVASDISTRWDEYQEELQIMLADFT